MLGFTHISIPSGRDETSQVLLLHVISHGFPFNPTYAPSTVEGLFCGSLSSSSTNQSNVLYLYCVFEFVLTQEKLKYILVPTRIYFCYLLTKLIGTSTENKRGEFVL